MNHEPDGESLVRDSCLHPFQQRQIENIIKRPHIAKPSGAQGCSVEYRISVMPKNGSERR